MPLYHAARPTVEVESYFDVMQKYWQNPQDMTAGFTIYWNNIGYLALCGLAGLGFMAAALVLYRKRKLEFAGDALAVKCLEPLVPILCGLAAGILSRTPSSCTAFWPWPSAWAGLQEKCSWQSLRQCLSPRPSWAGAFSRR